MSFAFAQSLDLWTGDVNSSRCLVIFPRATNRTEFNYADWIGLPRADVPSLGPQELVGPLAILTLAALCSLVRYHESWRFARLVHKVGLSKRAIAEQRKAEAAAAADNQPAEQQPTSSNANLFTAIPEPSLAPEPQDNLNFDLTAEYKRMLDRINSH